MFTFVFVNGAFAQAGQIINGSRTIYGSLNYGVDAGSTDAYVISLTPPIPNYVSGTRYTFKANTANTGPASLNIDARGVTAIKTRAGSVKVDPATNTICAGQVVDVIYDGTDFQMISQPCTASGGAGDALVANPLSQFASTTSAQLATVLSDEKGTSGGFARIDGILVIPTGKTVTQSNTLTYSGTDGSSVAFGAGGTVAYIAGNIATATALAVDPTACTGGQFVTDIAANGTLTCTTPAGGGNVSNTGTPVSGQLAAWTGATTIQGLTTLPTAAIPAFTGDVTNSTGSLATTISAGVVTLTKLANLATATLLGRTTAGTGPPEALTVLPTALSPAYTGDVTKAAGSLTTVLANVPSGTPHVGSALFTAIAAPATPAAGKASVYVDSTSKNIAAKGDAGVVNHGVQTITCGGSQFISAVNDAGLPTCGTPAGGGTVTASGTPTVNQVAVWTTATNLQGLTTLPKTALLGTTVYTDQANTWSTGAQSLAAATAFLLPSSAGAAPVNDGDLRFDTTKNTPVYGMNGNATLAVPGILCAGTGGSTNTATSGSGSDFAHSLTCPVPASFLTAGKAIQVCGQFSMTAAATAPTMLFALKAGATNVARTTAITLATSITGVNLSLCFQTMAAAAPGATASTYSTLLSQPDAFGLNYLSNQVAQPVNLATNGALTFGLVTQYGSNIAGNSITLDAMWVLAMN